MTTLAIDTETTGLFIHRGCRAFTISACTDDGQIYLWKFKVDPFTREVHYDKEKIYDFIRTIIQFDTLVFHNANFDLQALGAIPYVPIDFRERLCRNSQIHDTMVMSHTYRSDARHGLKELGILLLDYPDDDEVELVRITKKARPIAKKLGWCIADPKNLHHTLIGTQKEHFKSDYWIPEQLALHLNYPTDHEFLTTCNTYAGKDAERTMALYILFKELMEHDQWKSYDNARKLIYPILDMQSRGVTVSTKALSTSLKDYTASQTKTLATLRKLSGHPTFNPRSPIQLPTILFGKFGFQPVKHGKVRPSTDKEVTTALLADCPLTPNTKTLPKKYQFLIALQEYRKETTTLQYIANYTKHSLPIPRIKTHRILHPTYIQTSTGTGRLSGENPNPTNVGKKDMSNPFDDDKDKTRSTQMAAILGMDTESSFTLRNVFGPLPGRQWTCIDYEQFQLRIFAVVSESYDLIESIRRGEDIHNFVACRIFNKTDISANERTAAKAINFGLLFGAGPEKIEKLASTPGLYGLFMSSFPKAKKYLNVQQALARKNGYVHTLGGYRLYVPRLRPYAASCYVIQGTEAEIVRNAMVRIHDYSTIINPANPFKMIMMVHDELVFDSLQYTLSEYKFRVSLYKIMDIMERCGEDLGIPTKVDAKTTTTHWADVTPLEFDRTTPQKSLPRKKRLIHA